MNTRLATVPPPVFRSDLQARLLFEILASDEPRTEADLARRIGRPQPSVNRELSRLLDAGYLQARAVGRSKLISANERNPATQPLRALVLITVGPVQLLRETLQRVRGVRRALIFGSFAARAEGVAGDSPSDIDLLVVGDADRPSLYDATGDVEAVVHREINITFVSSARWESAEEPFLQKIMSDPRITLLDYDDTTAGLAVRAG